ncbi:dUTPase-like protein [Laetiporus sulphureus 93-53]|uniref:Deoxyuridine 5'-triphosphate nucleotidohydrolase n=1 Tax=Laetiporus sulphureus 93-53 TaxID=1314785 RepID=A0A165BSB7_9APHY|nr:dUTPase-like protein [Laetiporus sulphureus 93-53]KZT01563.1 dUTPase-like protein [Laetiporus sulphureus 93-53]
MYHQDTVVNHEPPKPPAIEIEGEPEFKKGYDHSDDTWEPRTNLTNADELLHEFHQQHPDAAKAPIRVVTFGGKRFELSSYEVAPISTHRINMSDHPDEFFLYHKMTDLAKSLKKSSNEAAGWDIYAAETHEIPPHSRAVVGMGVMIDPSKHTYTRIAPHSGLAARGIDVGAGVVDPDYTGELKVPK